MENIWFFRLCYDTKSHICPQNGKTVITQDNMWIYLSGFLEWEECISEPGTFDRKERYINRNIIFFLGYYCYFAELDFCIPRTQVAVPTFLNTSPGGQFISGYWRVTRISVSDRGKIKQKWFSKMAWASKKYFIRACKAEFCKLQLMGQIQPTTFFVPLAS